mgnify:CR=1 FL=1
MTDRIGKAVARQANEVLAADPVQPGYTLFNTLAQDEALELLESADDYF